MPSDAELRTLFQDAARPNPTLSGSGIDTATIIRRSKRRRLPRQVGAGSVLTLAVTGIGVASVTGLRPLMATTADSAAESSYTMNDSPTAASGGQPFLDGGSRSSPRSATANRCGEAVAEIAPNNLGLQLSTRFPATITTGAEVHGVVTLTNTGARPVSGTIASTPVITVSQSGITLWHSIGSAAEQSQITLAAGQSLDYDASFAPVLCSNEDELGQIDLPALPPGEYQLSAALGFFPDDASVDMISGPAATILLK